MSENGSEEPKHTRGRFRLIAGEQTGGVVYLATGLCERCLNCECGSQHRPLDFTSMAAAMKTFTDIKKNGIFQ